VVGTTLNIEDELYKKLVEESLGKYGTTRNLSKIVNEKLKLVEAQAIKKKKVSLPEIKLGKKIDWKFAEKIIEKEVESYGRIIDIIF
jgi:hypothetical protein